MEKNGTNMNSTKFIKYFFVIILVSGPVYSGIPFGINGIKAGITSSDFYDTNSQFNKGYQFGVFWEKNLTDNAGLCWEAVYTTRGGRMPDAAIITDRKTENPEFYLYDIYCSSKFFEIPILLKITIPVNNDFSLLFMSGPSISTARTDNSSLENKKTFTGTEDEYYKEQTKTKNNVNYDNGTYFSKELDKSIRLAFNWGIGFKYKKFTFETRYSTLYQDLGHLENIYYVGLRTYSIQFILGVKFINSKREQ